MNKFITCLFLFGSVSVVFAQNFQLPVLDPKCATPDNPLGLNKRTGQSNEQFNRLRPITSQNSPITTCSDGSQAKCTPLPAGYMPPPDVTPTSPGTSAWLCPEDPLPAGLTPPPTFTSFNSRLNSIRAAVATRVATQQASRARSTASRFVPTPTTRQQSTSCSYYKPENKKICDLNRNPGVNCGQIKVDGNTFCKGGPTNCVPLACDTPNPILVEASFITGSLQCGNLLSRKGSHPVNYFASAYDAFTTSQQRKRINVLIRVTDGVFPVTVQIGTITLRFSKAGEQQMVSLDLKNSDLFVTATASDGYSNANIVVKDIPSCPLINSSMSCANINTQIFDIIGSQVDLAINDRDVNQIDSLRKKAESVCKANKCSFDIGVPLHAVESQGDIGRCY